MNIAEIQLALDKHDLQLVDKPPNGEILVQQKTQLEQEASCFCHDGVSLQSVSGGAASEGYLGKVTLLIDGEYVDYVKAQPEQQAEPVTREGFNVWWDGDYDDSENRFEKDSAAYWAWAGWQAALAQTQQQAEPVAELQQVGPVEDMMLRRAALRSAKIVFDGRFVTKQAEPVAWMTPDGEGSV